MKIYIILILLSFITIINGQDNLYVNLVPYLHGCSGVPFGIGYSIKIGQCVNDVASFLNPNLNYDYQSYYFNFTNNDTAIALTVYNQENCQEYGINFVDLNPGIDCNYELEPVIKPFKGEVKGDTDGKLFYSVTISKQPELPDNSYIYSVYINNDNSVMCQDNFIYATSISNNLEIEYSDPKNTTQTFSCNKNSTPTTVKCLNGKCSTSYAPSSCKPSKINENYTEMIYCTK